MKYYLLMVREDGHWTVEFSDYEKETVEYERESLDLQHKSKDMKIISLNSASQAAIDERVKRFNSSSKLLEPVKPI